MSTRVCISGAPVAPLAILRVIEFVYEGHRTQRRVLIAQLENDLLILESPIGSRGSDRFQHGKPVVS